VFFKHPQGRKLIVLFVYVHIIVTLDDLTERHLPKEKLSTKFEIKKPWATQVLLGN
jgi:hypothetical protein